jgi:hypothetical protein
MDSPMLGKGEKLFACLICTLLILFGVLLLAGFYFTEVHPKIVQVVKCS